MAPRQTTTLLSSPLTLTLWRYMALQALQALQALHHVTPHPASPERPAGPQTARPPGLDRRQAFLALRRPASSPLASGARAPQR
jgi:hypothetical protein